MSTLQKPRFKISPTLLNNWLWCYKLDNGYNSFLEFLNLIKNPPTKEQLAGLQFESLAYSYANGQSIEATHEWYNGVCCIGNEIRGGQFQVDLYKNITVDGVDFLIHGILDVLHAGVIQDVKTTKNYHLNKFLNSAQHSAYFYLVPEARRFDYLIYDFKWLYKETYYPKDTKPIDKYIHEFMNFLEKHNLIDLYVQNFKVEE
jgi:hypothetical protein